MAFGSAQTPRKPSEGQASSLAAKSRAEAVLAAEASAGLVGARKTEGRVLTAARWPPQAVAFGFQLPGCQRARLAAESSFSPVLASKEVVELDGLQMKQTDHPSSTLASSLVQTSLIPEEAFTCTQLSWVWLQLLPTVAHSLMSSQLICVWQLDLVCEQVEGLARGAGQLVTPVLLVQVEGA